MYDSRLRYALYWYRPNPNPNPKHNRNPSIFLTSTLNCNPNRLHTSTVLVSPYKYNAEMAQTECYVKTCKTK
jgi:hypothetical protein